MENSLNITLAHEFYRCTESYKKFIFSSLNLNHRETLKKEKIECYNNYVDFLSHLYEFYSYFIKNELKNNRDNTYKIYEIDQSIPKHEKHDILLNFEMKKLLRNRKNRIINDYKDNLGWSIEFYEKEFNNNFAKHFRFIRNRRNHVDYKRASNEFDISLTDFYKLYHKYVLIMFHETIWLWKVDVENFKWESIEEFIIEISK